MLFNSLEFIFVFVPLAFVSYLVVVQFDARLARAVLLVASLAFYAYFDVNNLPIIGSSIAINYLCYLMCVRAGATDRAVRLAVIAAIVFNLALLGFYKYATFFVVGILGVPAKSFDGPVLPLAISFFTFQQISFVVDMSRIRKGGVSLIDYAAYVTFFPHLIAGPIVRHNELLPQFRDDNKPTPHVISVGLFLFSIGLAKKVMIADGLSVWVAKGYAKTAALSTIDAWLLALSYTFQLYFDFSGYSDMAIGLALLFGFRFPINFNSPYKATSIQDFWRRWHITLSTWLRDYLYIPLGGSRTGSLQASGNLMITMLLGGLWHGAGWNFVLWGGLHGLALVIGRLWSATGLAMGPVLGWLITFWFVVQAWIVFRAPSLLDAKNVVLAAHGGGPALFPTELVGLINQWRATWSSAPLHLETTAGLIPLYAAPILLGLLAVVLIMPNSNELRARTEKNDRVAMTLILVAGIVFAWSVKRLLESSAPNEFLYFQF